MARPDGPICVPCAIPMRPVKNGAIVCINSRGEDLSPEPYQIFSADIWGCYECGHEIIAGFGSGPLAEQHEPEFANLLARVTHQVRP